MKYFCFIVALGISSLCFAQQQYVYLYNKKDQRVLSKDSMDYIRVLKGPNTDKLYDVTEYYRSGKLKTIGHSSAVYPPVWEGPSISYWPNGNKQNSSTYRKSQRIGADSSFFYNGKLHTVLVYAPSDSILTDSIPQHLSTFIKFVNDSTGKALVVNGNGYDISYDESSGAIKSEGEVKNGMKDGTWKGSVNGVQYTELYKEGKPISGESVKDGKNRVYDSNSIEQEAEFPGGPQAFSDYLYAMAPYATSDTSKKMQGRVWVNVTIDTNGNVIDIYILRSPSKYMSDETVRILELSPPWVPATECGVAIKKKYTIPISYTL